MIFKKCLERAALVLILLVCATIGFGCDDDPVTDADGDTDIDADGDVDSDVDADSDADHDADADHEPETDPDGDIQNDVDEEIELLHIEEEPGCDDLNPLFCAFPYPSDRFLVADDSTATGYRLFLTPEFLPSSIDSETFDFSPYERLDGMSPATHIMTLFERPPDLTDAAGFANIGDSLEADSPTVLLDLESGERVAHWVELDVRSTDEAETVFYLRIADHLEENRSYAVAIRSLADSDGSLFEPSEAFRALRDGVITDSETLEARRPSFETLFDAFETASIDRDELQIAWWFHTASGEAIRGDMLYARADALERLGDEGIGCTVEEVNEGYGDDGLLLRRIIGTYTVPSYMEDPEPPTRYARGKDGFPMYVEDVEVDFTIIIPSSLVEGGAHAGPLITFGHGLLGTGRGTLNSSSMRDISNRTGTVMVATDWAGMSSEDVPAVAAALANVSDFNTVTERVQQGMINQIALTRTFSGICNDLDEFYQDGVNLVDSERLFYAGGSQGGIYGGTLMTLSPDIDRGILLVNGVVFPFMIERSTAFAPYLPIFEIAFPNRLHRALILPMASHLWDMSEPSGYLPHVSEGLEGIGPKQILSIAALNDAQVPNLSTDQAMRMVGVPVISGSVREPWGFEVVEPPYDGSGYITIDVGDRPVPAGNIPPEEDDGGHAAVGRTDVAIEIMVEFMNTGQIIAPCTDGLCDPD